jgi:prepilin-type N-terminal cleavage/methylation domain-containing protein
MTDRSDGFTLIETLAALTIFTAILVVFNSGITGSWRGVAAAEADRRAIAVASNLIEEAGIIWPLEAGTREGQSESGLAYRIDVAPHRSAGADVTAGNVSAFWLTVTVAPRGSTGSPRRPVTLRSLKRATP